MTADSNDAGSRPGTDTTDLFLHLTPERVLDAVDRGGYTTRAVCYPLASFENRVYEVELADRRRLVAKFYRPRRWSEEQILEEHRLLADLDGDELPVCAALPFPDGGTLREIDGLLYGLWERSGGRAPDELDLSLARRLGMLVGRLHAAAWRRPFKTRPRLDADRYIRRQLKFLKRHRLIPRP
ncbi:MAG: phosphotransferase, partial [Acidobacteriota bacterium]